MLSSKDIILISSIEWNFLWQHAQEIASRFARAGNRVLYIENTGVRSPRLQDASRVGHRLKSWSRSRRTGGVREVEPNLFVCSPLVLPPFGKFRSKVNRSLLLPLLAQTANALGMRDPIIWTHLPTNTALELIQILRTPQSAVVYYCIADFTQLTPFANELAASERAILQTSDLVFSNSNQLAARCQQWSNNVHVFPPGLNLIDFPESFLSTNGDAGNGFAKKSPVIGYVGGIHRLVSIDMLETMAKRRPDWHWLLVGPWLTGANDLSKLPNVTITGALPHNELAKHVRTFDVGIVPYRYTRETETVVPIKIIEYLAAGKPVVSTDLPAVCEFNSIHNVLITTPPQPDQFLEALEHALEFKDEISPHQRRAVAVLNDWEHRLESMCELIERELQKKNFQTDS